MKLHLPFLACILFILPLQTSSAQSQHQLNKAASLAYEKADTKLNRLYKQTMASKDVDPESKKNLRLAQRSWLPFIEAQIGTHYPVKKGENPRELYGSIYPTEVAMMKTELVKARVKQLEEFLGVDDQAGSSPKNAKKEALKNLKVARADLKVAYDQLIKFHDEDPGMEQVTRQAQEAWEKYKTAQLISQFPLREEEEKMPEAIYGPTYYPDHAKAEIKLIRQRIAVLVVALQ